MALLGAALGVGLGVGSQWVLLGGGTLLRQFGLYVMSMCAFHLLEFCWTAIFHPNKLSAQSYLLNHSREYHMALAAGVVEFVLEAWLVPSLKYPSSSTAALVMWLGLALVLAGQCVRTLAMLTAGSNFTHVVADSKAPAHQLVTHGIYSWVRHPSYAGWFWWSVGTQVLLGNPLCTLAYAAASFLFFRGRIRYEERHMKIFFGQQYEQYQARVGTGLPFIKGYTEPVFAPRS
jgi:protein-S-isoprenylcysteine O-methyltransferase